MLEYNTSNSNGSDGKDDGNSRGLVLHISKVEQIMFSSLILECLLCCVRKMVKHYMYSSEFVSHIGMQQFENIQHGGLSGYEREQSVFLELGAGYGKGKSFSRGNSL